jgi:hypothetical protein
MESLGDDRKTENGESEPDGLADPHSGEKGNDALIAARDHARDEGGDAGSGRARHQGDSAGEDE